MKTKKARTTKPMLGIDIGRVIIGGGTEKGADTQFFRGGIENALATPAMPGAFDTVARLVEHFDGNACLISKCGERVAGRSRAWLKHHRFYERTGMLPTRLRFCRERKDKAIHCRQLRVTHFIDDRVGVHKHLRGLVPNLYLFGPQRGPAPDWVQPMLSWAEAEELFALS